MDVPDSHRQHKLPAGCTVMLLAGVLLLAIGVAVRASHLVQNTRLAERFVRESFRQGDAASLYTSGDWSVQGVGIYADEAAVLNKLVATTRLDDLTCRSDLYGIVTCTLITTSVDGSESLTTDVLFDFYSGLVRSIDVPTARPPTRQ